MADFARAKGIDYPIAMDRDGKTVAAFGVDSYPDYYLIDRAGKLRVADLANPELESAVKVLLAEKAPAKLDARRVLASAIEQAKRQDKKVLVHLGAPT